MYLRSAYGLGLLVASFGLVWVYFFLKQNLPFLLKVTIVPFSLALAVFTVYSDAVIKSLTSIEIFGYEGLIGPIFSVYSFYVGVILGILIYKLMQAYVAEPIGLRKNQILYVLFGALIFAATSFVVSFLLPTFLGTFKFTVFDNFSFSIFLTFIVYAITRLHLFDIKVVTTELLTFGMWVFVLIRVFLADSLTERLANLGLLAILVLFGTFLIRSILKEVKNREQIETLNQQLQASIAELQKLDQLKSDFVNLASHQLRTPLTPIKGFSDMLRKGDVGPLSEEQKDVADKIFISAERMVQLVNDFLDVSRLEKQGGFSYNFVLNNPEATIKKVVDDLQGQAKEKNLALSLDIKISPATKIRLDTLKFPDAISNIIQNAIKYTPRGNIWVKMSEDNDNVVIMVKDTGVGIDKDDIPKIFQKFFRTKEVSRITEGTGLGLYFTRRVIEDHGGHVWVQSEGLEKGTEFTVKVPKATLAMPASTPVPSPAPNPASIAPTTSVIPVPPPPPPVTPLRTA